MTKVALLVSRQPRMLEPNTRWLRALSASIEHSLQQGWSLVTGEGIVSMEFAAWEYERRSARSEIVPTPPGKKKQALKERDEMIVEKADVVVAVAVRENGQLFGLAEKSIGNKPVLSVMSQELSPSFSGNSGLVALGAEPLELNLYFHSERAPPTRPNFESRNPDPARKYLWHLTRSCPGIWPGQTWADYFQSLSDGHSDSSHSARDCLNRIWNEKRIRSCEKMIRGGHSVVCMTENHPLEMLEMRQYRPALVRWDFEEAAIGICRRACQRKGILPVIYVSADEYDAISPQKRYLYQKTDPPDVDFRHENEWRSLGDIDLGDLDKDEVCFFLP